MSLEFLVKFQAIRCLGCDAVRVRGRTCPDCGRAPDPREVDLTTQSRRRAIEQIREALRAPPPHTHIEREPLAVIRTLLPLPLKLLGLLTELEEEGTVSAAATTVVSEFRSVEARVAGAVRLRPWLGVWAVTDRLTSSARSLICAYLDALDADTMSVAQRLGREGQHQLDLIAEEAKGLNAQIAALERLSATNVESALMSVAAAAAEGVDNLSELRSAGTLAYRLVTGSDPTDASACVAFHVLRATAELTGDGDQLIAAAREVFSVLSPHTRRLRDLAADPGWQEDFIGVALRSWDATSAHLARLAAVKVERQVVGSLLQLGHSSIEGPARRLLAMAAFVVTGTSYRKQVMRDATVLVHDAPGWGLGSCVQGMDPAIRIAVAHDSWTFDPHDAAPTVTFELRSGTVTMRVDELVDHIYTATLSWQALYLGLLAAFLAQNLAVPPAAFDALGLGPEEMCEATLAMAGWKDPVIVIQHGVARVQGGRQVSAASLPEAGALVPYLSADVATIELHGTGLEATHTLSTDVDALRRFSASGEDDRDLAFLEALNASRLDDEPVLPRDDARTVVARLAASALAPLSRRRMIDLRRLAERLCDRDLAIALTTLLWLSRVGLLRVADRPGMSHSVEGRLL